MRAQMILVLVGLWLMAAPDVLGYDGAAATSDRIAGPVLAAVSFLAVFQITRGLRWANLPIGAWLAAAPWVLGFPADATVNSMLCGAAALVLAPIGSPDQRRYGGGWIALRDTSRLLRPRDRELSP
jgi:hypothetical protein